MAVGLGPLVLISLFYPGLLGGRAGLLILALGSATAVAWRAVGLNQSVSECLPGFIAASLATLVTVAIKKRKQRMTPTSSAQSGTIASA